MTQFNHNGAPPILTSAETFAELRGAGQIDYVHIDAVPRSMSTILPIALCEAGVVDSSRNYVQSDEPLNWRTRGMGFAAVAPLLLEARGDDERPATIFEKSTARNVYPETFDDICRAADGIIFTVREPGKQMYSLAQRIINDLEYGKGSGNRVVLSGLESSEYRAALEKVDDFLEISGHHDGHWPAGERPYMQPSWREIGNNFDHAVEEGVPTTVVDGTYLTKYPVETFQDICATLGLPYSPTMTDNWSAVGDTFQKDHTNWSSAKTEQGGFVNGWISRATHTRGIEEDTTPSIDLSKCPPRMCRYIGEVATVTYEKMIAHPNSNKRFDQNGA